MLQTPIASNLTAYERAFFAQSPLETESIKTIVDDIRGEMLPIYQLLDIEPVSDDYWNNPHRIIVLEASLIGPHYSIARTLWQLNLFFERRIQEYNSFYSTGRISPLNASDDEVKKRMNELEIRTQLLEPFIQAELIRVFPQELSKFDAFGVMVTKGWRVHCDIPKPT